MSVGSEFLASKIDPACRDDIRLAIHGNYRRSGDSFIGINAMLQALCPDFSIQYLYMGTWQTETPD